ncbi:hypothetical protein BKI52_00170 [marine bacterium AO1-C]|nr:hypothetical protein BKI52_00170 [marine bacterium AO1-C]
MKVSQVVIVSIIVIASCNARKPTIDAKLVLLNRYYHDSIIKTDTVYLTKIRKKDTVFFCYADTLFTEELLHSREVYDYSFMKLAHSDSAIYLDYVTATSLVAQKTFNINNQEFKVSKYYYDVKGSFDEESSFFYHKDYGVLVCFNDGWSELAYTIEYDQTSRILIDRILNDTTKFYPKIRLSKEDEKILDSLIEQDIDFEVDLTLPDSAGKQ